MLKLLKYELRKTWIVKVVLLCVTAIAEVAFLIGLYGNMEDTMALSVIALVFLAIGGIMAIGLESIATLHRDMNTKQSYMLFMTPNSCYKILGAKMIEFGVSVLVGAAFYFALGGLDITLLFAKEGMLNEIWQSFQDLLAHITINGRALDINVRSVAAAMFVLATSWISLVSTAYLADVISSALLNGKKFNGIISFVLFLFISWGTGRLTSLLTSSIVGNVPLMLTYGAINLVFSAIMYVVTAIIMERKLSV